MHHFDFDEIIDRRHTNSLKYDFAAERGYPEDVLPFWVADMDFRAPQAVREAIRQRAEHGIFGYSSPKEEYYAALEKWFDTRHGWRPGKDALVITPGVVFALSTAVRTFTQAGDAVLVTEPVYYPFFSTIEGNGRRLVTSSLLFEDGAYRMDFADMEKKITENKVRLLLLCSPHNPVGRVWRREELERLASICLAHDVLVVADEIHADFVRPGNKHTPFASLSPEVAARTITCTAPSKTFNLAGLQLSNIFITEKSLRQRFQKEVYSTGYGEPNLFGLLAAQAAYSEGGPWLDSLLAYLEENIAHTKRFLAEHLPQVQLIEPEGTYLLWLDFRACGLEVKALDRKIIEEARLWLDDGAIFGKSGAGFQRLNIACPRATLEKGLEALARVFG
ncbi:pyridoxal phosphate-dependent aminotransferase [Selenomonas sputigena]|uniref:cysteine-S-conjugate beta-lyase n=1 Tax=Selenomonas sputigena TaxID=69823 RepID=A0ABV3X4M9_9FIRM